MNSILATLFPLWAITLSIAAYFYPAEFSLLKPAIVPLLSIVMLGMGMTLTTTHFRDVIKKTRHHRHCCANPVPVNAILRLGASVCFKTTHRINGWNDFSGQ